MAQPGAMCDGRHKPADAVLIGYYDSTVNHVSRSAHFRRLFRTRFAFRRKEEISPLGLSAEGPTRRQERFAMTASRMLTPTPRPMMVHHAQTQAANRTNFGTLFHAALAHVAAG